MQACRLVLHTIPNCWAPNSEAVNIICKVFWYDSTWEMNPRSTDCEAVALTTTPSRRFLIMDDSNALSSTKMLILHLVYCTADTCRLLTKTVFTRIMPLSNRNSQTILGGIKNFYANNIDIKKWCHLQMMVLQSRFESGMVLRSYCTISYRILLNSRAHR